jgi:hypothetical protein
VLVCLGSAWLVTTIFTVCFWLTFTGAVYNPLAEIVPIAGIAVQVTAVLLVLVTVAVNCCDCDGFIRTSVGVTDTRMPGISVTVAEAVLVGSATLVAMIDRLC